MGIRVNNHETLTLDIGGGDLTVPTSELFKAWSDKHIFKNAGTTKPSIIPAPRVGERYLTSIMHPDGRMCHSFVMDGEEEMTWSKGMAWAKEKGGDLPNRIEQAAMLAFMPEQFKKELYWSNTQHAGNSDYAWYQSFDYGGQGISGKNDECLVRAVRREFSDSVI